MSVAFVQENGVVKISVSTTSIEPRYLLYSGSSTIPNTSSIITYSDGVYKIGDEELVILDDTSFRSSQHFHRFYDTTTSIYVLIVRRSGGTIVISEVSSRYTVDASTFPSNKILTGELPINLAFSNGATLEDGGVGLSFSNAASPETVIQGLSYVVDIVKVVEDTANTFDAIDDYAGFVAGAGSGVRYSTILSIPLSSTSDIAVFDTAKQYNNEKYYCYVAFLYLVLGSDRWAGWKVDAVVSKISKESTKITERDTDDLYREDEIPRIVAAQNKAAPQRIAMKKFPKIGDGGSYFYSILVCSMVPDNLTVREENLGEYLVGELATNLATELKAQSIIVYDGSDDAGGKDESGLYSFSVSGIGVVSELYDLYKPVIDGTLKLTLSNK